MANFLRTCATPLSFVTFVAVAVTGLMLLFGVRGPLGDVHEWIGVAFIVTLGLHLVRNWRGLLAMLSLPRSKAIVGALGVALAVLILAVTPFGSGGQGHGGGFHGAGQIMHRMAQAPLDKMAPAFGLTGEQAVTRLKQGGIKVSDSQTSLAQVAEENNTALPQLLTVMLSGTDEDG
jgi:hypothetical protein